jgi:sec-independent protein translocase protein TatA
VPNIGPLEIALLLGIALILFGPKRLPQLGRSVGKGVREFRTSVNEITGEDSASAKKADKETA